MKKMLVFDMDGTIADLYGMAGWLEMLRAEDTTPYELAAPMFSEVEINAIQTLRKNGWKVAITTWTAKGGSKEYNARVRNAKLAWLIEHDFPFDEFHAIKYGTTKANSTRAKADYQILFDDNEEIRKGWSLGEAIDAKDMRGFLKSLIEEMIK